MSIKETKFRKGYVETPYLRTDEIEYMGHELPLYDYVTRTLVDVPQDYKKELGKTATSYQNSQCNYIRILTHSPAFMDDTLLTLTNLELDFAARSGSEVTGTEFIVLYVYGWKDGEYIYLGASSTVYRNPTVAAMLPFAFDNIQLFEEIGDNNILGYDQIFIRPHVVTIDENGIIIGGLDDTDWNSTNHTSVKLKGCNYTNMMYNPYITSDDQSGFTPHIIFSYRKNVFTTDQKIPHNLNGDIHLTPNDKEKIQQLSELGELILAGETIIPKVVSTKEDTQDYRSTGAEVIVSSVIKPQEFIGNKITKFIFKTPSNTNDNYKITNKWLQADCFDSEGNLIDTFFSISPASEQDDFSTTWQFNNLEILEIYDSIEFRLSNSQTTRQTTYINFKGSSLKNSSNARILYKDGWVTKWAIGQNVNNIETNQFTSDFVIVFEPVTVTGYEFIRHLTDKNQHITEEERNNIQEWLDISKNIEVSYRGDVRDYFPQFDGYDRESVLGFSMKVEDEYENSKINSITIRRSDDSNLQAHELYLYANCIDKNNNVIDIFYSIDKKNQQASDNRITKWSFDDFTIPIDTKTIEFYLTSTLNDPQLEHSFRIGVLKQGDTILYKEGWQIRWPNTNKEYKNHTADFFVDYSKKESNIITHPNDEDVHVSYADREKLETLGEIESSITNHIGNTSLHWQQSDREKINTLESSITNHTGNTSLHWQQSDREKLETLGEIESSITEHAGNTSLHWQDSDRAKVIEFESSIQTLETNTTIIDGQITILSDQINLINEKLDTTTLKYTTQTEGLDLVDDGRLGTKCIQLSKEHFIPYGFVTQVEIPYFNIFQSDITGEKYLAIQIFYEDDTEDTVKTAEETYYSINTQSQPNYSGGGGEAGKGTCVFKFNNLDIPKDYKFIRFMAVTDKSLVPNGKTGDNCTSFRIRVLQKDGSWFFDDDLCSLYPSNNTNNNYLALVNVTYNITILDGIDATIQNSIDTNNAVNNHTSDTALHWQDSDRNDITNLKAHVADTDIHVTATQKNTWDATSTNLTSHTNDTDIHFTENQKQTILDLLYTEVKEDIAPQQTTPETSYNYSKYGFVVRIDEDVTIDKLTLYCNDNGSKGGDVYAMIWKGDTMTLQSDSFKFSSGQPTYITVSNNTQTHEANATLVYEFDKFDVKAGEYVAVAFKTDNTATSFSGFTEICFRVVDLEYNADNFKGGILGNGGGVWTDETHYTSTNQHKYMVKHTWETVRKASIQELISSMQTEISQLRSELDELKGIS